MTARKAMTPERLYDIAVYYCRRYLTSEARLRHYLQRRIRRETMDNAAREALMPQIESIVRKMSEAGLVNDREAGSARLRAVLRAGYATGLAVPLAARSARVGRETVAAELPAALSETMAAASQGDESDGAALARLALRRGGRGPYRAGGESEDSRRRDIAWLRRRGFRFDDIRAAMESTDG